VHKLPGIRLAMGLLPFVLHVWCPNGHAATATIAQGCTHQVTAGRPLIEQGVLLSMGVCAVQGRGKGR
jgi:hypothetical protein